MRREIRCPECRPGFNLHPEDYRNGHMFRMLIITARKPKDHKITLEVQHGDGPVETTVEILDTLKCDLCGKAIHDGDKAYAITIWNMSKESYPPFWEVGYAMPGTKFATLTK